MTDVKSSLILLGKENISISRKQSEGIVAPDRAVFKFDISLQCSQVGRILMQSYRNEKATMLRRIYAFFEQALAQKNATLSKWHLLLP